jgi:hypothetical protein
MIPLLHSSYFTTMDGLSWLNTSLPNNANWIYFQGKVTAAYSSPINLMFELDNLPQYAIVNLDDIYFTDLTSISSNLPVGTYAGGVLAPNNNIYMIPYSQSTQTNWHYIDSSNNYVSYNTSISALQSNAYSGGVLAPNNRIYMAPYSQSNQTTWHYINPSSNVITGYQTGISALQSNAYSGGVLAPNNRIYLVPYVQSSQSTWHYIDLSSNTVVGYQAPSNILQNAYSGGVLAPNGRIYLAPYAQATQSTWHYIDTQSDLPFISNVCTNPMFNKF